MRVSQGFTARSKLCFIGGAGGPKRVMLSSVTHRLLSYHLCFELLLRHRLWVWKCAVASADGQSWVRKKLSNNFRQYVLGSSTGGFPRLWLTPPRCSCRLHDAPLVNPRLAACITCSGSFDRGPCGVQGEHLQFLLALHFLFFAPAALALLHWPWAPVFLLHRSGNSHVPCVQARSRVFLTTPVLLLWRSSGPNNASWRETRSPRDSTSRADSKSRMS